MSNENLKPFKVGDITSIQTKQPTTKKEEQKLIFNFPYLESILDEEGGVDEIKAMYRKSYQALQKLDKTDEINKVMNAYDRSMELMDELVKIKNELTSK